MIDGRNGPKLLKAESRLGQVGQKKASQLEAPADLQSPKMGKQAMLKTGMTLMFIAAAVFSLSSATAEELTWRNDIEPMIAANCGACHGADKPTYREWRLLSDEERAKIGPRMDTYEHFMSYVIWPATGAQQRRLDDGTNRGGEPGNMFKYLGNSDEERAANLATLQEWLGAWNLNRWEARDDVQGISKEQLEAITAKY